MNRVKMIIISILLIGIFALPMNVMANNVEQAKPELAGNMGVVSTGEKTVLAKNQPLRGANPKNFTLTKKSAGAESKIGDYDKFTDAVMAMDVNDKDSLYTIYVNKDVVKTEPSTYRSNNKIRLTSGDGGPFKFTEGGEGPFIAIQTDAEMHIDNVILDGNNKGQCLFISNNGKVTIGKGTTIQNFADSTTYDGPAIFLTGGTLNVEDGAVIQNNNSNQQGGVIQAYYGTKVNIKGGSFKNNKSNTSDGGAIAAYGELNITGGTFENNQAKKTGGAVLVGSRSNASINNATFKGNRARTGGAIYASNNLNNLDKTTFENNQAIWGGAICAAKELNLSNTIFTKNLAGEQGGAIYATKGIKSSKDTFTKNQAAKQGGAIFIEEADSSIKGSKFTENGSGSGGGAILVDHNNKGTTNISNTSFEDNFSNRFGGGVYLGMNAKLNLSQCKFAKNQAAYGGGVASAGTGIVDANLTNINVEETNFDENQALMGGAIFTAFPMEVNKSTFSKNKALLMPQDDQKNPHISGVGGAIEVIYNKTSIKGSTFKENYAFGSGGAVGINGVTRDREGNIIGIKDVKVEVLENTKFISNTCKVGQGGAIYTIPYSYDLAGQDNYDRFPADFKEKAYKNLMIDNTTLFKGNKSESGLHYPPDNYQEYTNLKFSSDSDIPHKKDMVKSLLNNYDVNYQGRPYTEDNKSKIVVPQTGDNENIALYFAIMGISIIILAGLVHRKTRKN